MKTTGIRQEFIEVDITPITFLRDLFKHEFLGYDIYDDFKVEDNKLYVYIDTSYHGSPILEPKLISDDINKIKKFETLSELIKLYSK
jgi:hypothetical protein